jgi:hypothetical protein
MRELGCAVVSPTAAMERWRSEWLSSDRPMVPMLVLPGGAVFRVPGTLRRLADPSPDDKMSPRQPARARRRGSRPHRGKKRFTVGSSQGSASLTTARGIAIAPEPGHAQRGRDKAEVAQGDAEEARMLNRSMTIPPQQGRDSRDRIGAWGRRARRR